MKISIVIVALSAFLSFGWPFATIITQNDNAALYQAIAGDVFYYLKIAASVTEHGFPSMDERTVSNGYMPFWQAIVVLLDFASGDTSGHPETMIRLVFLTSFALAALGIVRLAVFVNTLYGLPIALLTLPFLVPGVVFWVFQNVYWREQVGGLNFGLHAWSFSNGMESGLCLLLFALIVARVHKIERAPVLGRHDAALLGILVFLAFMARLDDLFLGLACGVFCLSRALRQRDVTLIFNFAAVPVAGSLAYLAVNLATVGVPLPSSGTSKILFLHNNFFELLGMVGLSEGVHFKMIPLGLGLLAPLAWGIAAGEKKALPRRLGLMEVLVIYVAMKSVFLLSFVPLVAIGGWYLTSMIAALNLMAVLILAPALAARVTPAVAAAAMPFAVFAMYAAAQNTFLQLTLPRTESYTSVNRELCQNRDRHLAALEAATGTAEHRIIDTADGSYAYCLGLPAVGFQGLGDSVEIVARRRTQSLYGVALDLGHDIIVHSDVKYASYSWRAPAEAAGYTLHPLVIGGPIEFWRLQPPDDTQSAPHH